MKKRTKKGRMKVRKKEGKKGWKEDGMEGRVEGRKRTIKAREIKKMENKPPKSAWWVSEKRID